MRYTAIPTALAAFLTASDGFTQASAPDPSPEAPEASCKGTCVPKEDMAKIVEVLREKKCLQTEKPSFELDPINIVVDKSGRVFYSGAAPNPYTVRMKWCSYTAEAQGKVNLVAALMEPRIWGFRFRPKAYIGVLPLEAYNIFVANQARELAGEATEKIRVSDLWDAGVMVDFFHYAWFNVNVATGFRSFGGGVGADLTSNFGLYAGYANTWGTWHHNVNLGLWFSFWNPT